MITTAKDFTIFVEEAKRLIERLGLKEYRFAFVHGKLNDKERNRAWTLINVDAMAVQIGLSKNWYSDEVTELELKKSAFHEVMHVALAKLAYGAEARYVPAGYYDEQEHIFIRRMEGATYD